jgi:MerR family transcriptional regulator, redox-sensitive transcriptional activator SoxR
MVEVKRFTVGEVAERTGIATSALRFYEANGLIRSERTAAGHRRYRPDVVRRVSFIVVAQKVGLSLAEIKAALDRLPHQRTPSKRDWEALARSWQPLVEERIAILQRLRTDLAGCIGCGCLSLQSCRIWNPDDAAASLGTGARYLLSDDRPSQPQPSR